MGEETRKRNPEDMFFDHDLRIRLLEKEMDLAKVLIDKAQALAEKETARAKMEVEKDTENALQAANREIQYVKLETVKIQKSVEEQAKTVAELDRNLSKLMVKFGCAIGIVMVLIEIGIKAVWK